MKNRLYPAPEELVGRAIRRLRGHRSQRWLAEEMTAMGYSWQQSTAAKTEAGERPIRLNEALALAQVFQVDLETLITPAPQNRRDQLLLEARQLAGQIESLEQARDNLRARSMDLAVAIEETEANMIDLNRQLDAVLDEVKSIDQQDLGDNQVEIELTGPEVTPDE